MRVRSCLIDGEAIIRDASGPAVFDLLRRGWHGAGMILCASHLLELDGKDLRRVPIEDHKRALANLLRRQREVSPSMSTIPATGRSSISTPARSAARASYRSAWDPRIRPAAPIAC